MLSIVRTTAEAGDDHPSPVDPAPRERIIRCVRHHHLHRHFQKEIAMSIFFEAFVFLAGYVASIYSWPRFKVWINGAAAEIASLRTRAAALESKIKAL
jgi:hypothetical protein